MELHRIRTSSDPVFAPLFSLYEEAFPPEERRSRSQLEQLLTAEEAMCFSAVLLPVSELSGESYDIQQLAEKTEMDGKILCGLLSYWQLPGFVYLEHLATFPDMRNHRIGSRVLAHLAEQFPGLRLLEVEPPANELTRRRIGYYERQGFRVLDRSYLQPPYSAPSNGQEPFPLWIMGSEESEHLADYTEQIRQRVYRDSYRFG